MQSATSAILCVLFCAGVATALNKRECSMLFIEYWCAMDGTAAACNQNGWTNDAQFEFGAGRTFHNHYIKIYKRAGGPNDVLEKNAHVVADASKDQEKRRNVYESAAGRAAGANNGGCLLTMPIHGCIVALITGVGAIAYAGELRQLLADFKARFDRINPGVDCQ